MNPKEKKEFYKELLSLANQIVFIMNLFISAVVSGVFLCLLRQHGNCLRYFSGWGLLRSVGRYW